MLRKHGTHSYGLSPKGKKTHSEAIAQIYEKFCILNHKLYANTHYFMLYHTNGMLGYVTGSLKNPWTDIYKCNLLPTNVGYKQTN